MFGDQGFEAEGMLRSGFKEEGAARFTGKQVGRLLLQFRWALKMANG